MDEYIYKKIGYIRNRKSLCKFVYNTSNLYKWSYENKMHINYIRIKVSNIIQSKT